MLTDTGAVLNSTQNTTAEFIVPVIVELNDVDPLSLLSPESITSTENFTTVLNLVIAQSDFAATQINRAATNLSVFARTMNGHLRTPNLNHNSYPSVPLTLMLPNLTTLEWVASILVDLTSQPGWFSNLQSGPQGMQPSRMLTKRSDSQSNAPYSLSELISQMESADAQVTMLQQNLLAINSSTSAIMETLVSVDNIRYRHTEIDGVNRWN